MSKFRHKGRLWQWRLIERNREVKTSLPRTIESHVLCAVRARFWEKAVFFMLLGKRTEAGFVARQNRCTVKKP